MGKIFLPDTAVVRSTMRLYLNHAAESFTVSPIDCPGNATHMDTITLFSGPWNAQ